MDGNRLSQELLAGVAHYLSDVTHRLRGNPSCDERLDMAYLLEDVIETIYPEFRELGFVPSRGKKESRGCSPACFQCPKPEKELKMDITSLFPSQYLKAADVTQPRVFTITKLAVEEVGQEKDRKGVLYFAEDPRGLVLNKTNANMIAHGYGNDTDHWIGKPVELRSEAVSFQSRIVDAIRVRVVSRPPPAEQVDGDW